jgi:CRISPR-associated exonuclease Cas4
MSSWLAEEDDWVLLSEVEHWAYCSRQWSLIHLEQWFSQNDDTVRGDLAHSHLDDGGRRRRGAETTWWSVEVWSDALRLRGRCDRVLVSEDGSATPIEHKSGRRSQRAAALQLAGQAMCLEEMLGRPIDMGGIYLMASNELQDVEISDELRLEVRRAADGIRSWRREQGSLLPVPSNDRRCSACSLQSGCFPSLVGSPNQVRGLEGATWWP